MRKNLLYVVIVGIAMAVTIVLSSVTWSTSIEGTILELEEAILVQDWDGATDRYEVLRSDWQRRKPWAELTNSVQVTFDIERLLARLGAALRTRSPIQALDIAADLKELWIDVKR